MRAKAEDQRVLHFGAICAPLHEQLGESADRIKRQQKAADAVTFLYMEGVLTPSEATKARKRIIRQIEAALNTTEAR